MPWRRQQPPEPPLITRQTPADGIYRAPQSAKDATGRAVYSNRLDSELQKKADRVAKQLAGSRTNELDVQVVNEEVYIRARPMWFWQRRQLTDELRNLPGFDPKRIHVTVY